MEVNLSSGNDIVDAVGKINFTGNTIPEVWYKTIVNENGKPNLLAINLLAEIVYWYRPTEVRDENNNMVSYKKKFYADLLQKNYRQIKEKFNISEDQARNALKFLESLGVITRRLRTIKTTYGVINNVLYIELHPRVLENLTFPPAEEADKYEGGGGKNTTTTLKKDNHVAEHEEGDDINNTTTNTENTTKTTQKITTTPDAAICGSLEDFNLSKEDICSIKKAANGSIDKIHSAVDALKHSRTPIDNVVGFLISAIKNNYSGVDCKVKYTPHNNTGFNDFNQRSYDRDEFDELARIAVSRQSHIGVKKTDGFIDT